MVRKQRAGQRKRKRRYHRRGGANIDIQPPGGAPIDMPEPVRHYYPKRKLGILDQAKGFLKRNHIISRGLNAIGARSLGNLALRHGYGFRRRKIGGCRF